MKILFVNFIKFWGGGESWTYQVMDELRKRNHSIILLSNTQSELLIKAQQNNFETHTVTVNKFSFIDPLVQNKIKKQLIEIKPDAIILNSTLELKTIGVQISASGCKYVIFNRGIPRPIKLDVFKKYLFTKVVSVVVVNSDYVKKKIVGIAKLMKKEPVVIHHGISSDTEYFTTGQTKNIAIVGRLSHEKGVDIAINIFQKVLSEHADAKLWIIGDGKEMNSLKKQSTDLGISDSVCFFGHVQNVQELLVQCSMLILTSRWEGFGLVLLEAMKLKIPCLAFDHIAANEIIENNKSGFLIPKMDIDLMNKKIVFLLNNKHKANEMGERGYQILIEKFSINSIIDQHERLLLNYKS